MKSVISVTIGGGNQYGFSKESRQGDETLPLGSSGTFTSLSHPRGENELQVFCFCFVHFFTSSSSVDTQMRRSDSVSY